MLKKLFRGIFLFTFVVTKEADLPLCPTNVLYFPQNLPMHCRMPTNADFPGPLPVPLPTMPPIFQMPPSDKRPSAPIPIPIPQGVPGPMQMPGPIPFPGPMAIPGPSGPLPLPGPFPGPIPLQAGPAQKLPVIVMPFYSPDPSFKKTERPNYPQHPFRPKKKRRRRHRRRRPFMYSSPDTSSSIDTDISTDISSSSSSEYEGWWKGRKNSRRFNGPNRMKMRKHNHVKRQLLTPVLQYITKDGYVIFEKKISKNEAKDWLNVNRDEKIEDSTRVAPEARDMESNEPIDLRSGEKEPITENNVEFITKRSAHRLNRVKARRNNLARKVNFERPV